MAIGHGDYGYNHAITLSDRVFVEGFPYAQRYNVLQYGCDVWLREGDAPVLEPVTYIDGSGTLGTVSDYRDFGELIDEDNCILEQGWYVVNDSESFDKRPSIVGSVNIILTDGVELNMKHGFRVNDKLGMLTVYGQTLDESTAGKLICGAYDGQAAIGGNDGMKNGLITIESGSIEAYGGSDGAGIGGGNNASNGEIVIHGGTVKAVGGNSWNGAGAGIGGGNHGGGGTISITGGTVDATGAKWGAGIGGGNHGGSGEITIVGGTITARGNNGGAGIGGGDDGDAFFININGGTIEAHGNVAIGHGEDGTNREIFLGSKVHVEGVPYAKRYTVLQYGCDIWLKDDYEPDEEPVAYVSGDGTTHSVQDYKDFGDLKDESNTVLREGWYVVNFSETYDNRPVIVGKVNIILTDGVELNMKHGFRVDDMLGQLTVYGQTLDENAAGKLICGAYDNQAAIGGNDKMKNGRIVIESGNIEAYGGSNGAGIGGGNKASNGVVVIHGGTVKAVGGNSWNGAGAGIGGGNHGGGGTIHITGGTVDATGANWGAGIGGGNCGSSGQIAIDGGTIIAKGNKGGAGIGGGDDGDAFFININGGTIEAHGKVAIGHGEDGANKEVILGTNVYVDGYPFEQRYNIIEYGCDIWLKDDYKPVTCLSLPADKIR